MASNFELINETDKRDDEGFETLHEFIPEEKQLNTTKQAVRRGKEKSYMIIEEFDSKNDLESYLC
jgi:hypothetical protein